MGRLLVLTLAFGLLSCSKSDTPVDPTKGSADVTRSFRCDLAVGMVWRYSYLEFDHNPSEGSDYKRWGTHEWRILSMTSSGPATLYQATDARRDSIRVQKRSQFSGWPDVDTTYAKNEDLSFTIAKRPTDIFFGWASRYIADSLKYMPRAVPLSTPNTVRVILVYYPGNWSNKYSDFTENIGLTFSTWADGGNHTWGEKLILLEFIKP